MGASIVFVPLVFTALIALVAPAPVLLSVSLMLVFELVRSYPEDAVVEKFNPRMVMEALRFGFVTSAVLKTALSPVPGTLPLQLPAALKSVPVLFHVLLAANADWLAMNVTSVSATSAAN